MKNLCVFPFFFLLLISVWGHGGNLDSLKKELPGKNKEEKLVLLLKIADQLVDSAIFYDQAKELLAEAWQLAQNKGNEKSRVKILNYQGLTEFSSSNYEKAADYFYESLKLANTIADSSMIARVTHNLGMVYDELEEYDDAIDYYLQSAKYEELIQDTLGMARSYINLSISYQNKKMLQQAQEYCDKAHSLVLLKKDTVLLVTVLNNQGTLAYDRKEYDKSLGYYQETLRWLLLLNDKEGVAFAYNNIGLAYLDKKEYKLAGEYFFKALKLAQELKLYDFSGDIYSNLKFYYEALGDYKNALSYYDQYNTVYDSLIGEKKNKQIRQLQAKYGMEKKQTQILLLEQEANRQQMAIRSARIIQILLSIVALIVVGFLFYMIRMWRKEKKLRQELHEKSEMLKTLNASKDKFFSIIAHDLRNPFHALFNYTSLLRRGIDDFSREEVNDILNDLYLATEQGYNLLQNLLFWTRSQSDRLYIYRTDFDMAKLVQEVLELARPNAVKKEQQLMFTYSEDCVVNADRDMVSTIVRNLVFNAIKFSQHGKIIRVDFTCENDQTVLRVIDQGVGMDAEQLRKLFVIDEHISNVGTDGELGSGLGLILCQEFASKNNARIEVESEQGKGSVFSFILPCKPFTCKSE